MDESKNKKTWLCSDVVATCVTAVDIEMVRGEMIAELRELADLRDVEGAHADADEILCDLLLKLGYADVVEAYEAVPKWYA